MYKKTGVLLMCMGTAMLLAALSLLLYNHMEDKRGGDMAQDILASMQTVIEEEDAVLQETGTGMLEMIIGGYGYIGSLSIPALNLTLPVMSDWDDVRLKMSPCRYFGSLETDDMVICGHNYSRHFGNLKNLREGDMVLFTDVSGEPAVFSVKMIETLLPTQIQEMIENHSDLTLYTCTYGGESRLTVRCDRWGKGDMNAVPEMLSSLSP